MASILSPPKCCPGAYRRFLRRSSKTCQFFLLCRWRHHGKLPRGSHVTVLLDELKNRISYGSWQTWTFESFWNNASQIVLLSSLMWNLWKEEKKKKDKGKRKDWGCEKSKNEIKKPRRQHKRHELGKTWMIRESCIKWYGSKQRS